MPPGGSINHFERPIKIFDQQCQYEAEFGDFTMKEHMERSECDDPHVAVGPSVLPESAR
jgi:hypothetical protein